MSKFLARMEKHLPALMTGGRWQEIRESWPFETGKCWQGPATWTNREWFGEHDVWRSANAAFGGSDRSRLAPIAATRAEPSQQSIGRGAADALVKRWSLRTLSGGAASTRGSRSPIEWTHWRWTPLAPRSAS